MKKKKVVSIVLAAIMCFALTACNSSNGGNDGAPAPIAPVTQPDAFPVEKGLHNVSVTATDNVLINADATTEYTIVYPENAASEVVAAARAMATHFLVAVGATVAVQEESEQTYSDTAKYLVVGNCKLFAAAGLTMPTADIGATGVYVKTAGKSAFMTGKTEYGISNAVYVFLEHVLGHDHLYLKMDAYTAKKGEKVMLPEMDIVEKPDFEFSDSSMNTSSDALAANRIWSQAMFMRPDTKKIYNMSDQYSEDPVWHNSFNWFWDWYKVRNSSNPEDIHYENKWLSNDGKQLCYSGHGEKTVRDAMLEHAKEYALKAAETDPVRNNIAFTQQDESVWCTCDACKAAKEKYGADSGVLIKFAKDLAKLVNDALKDETPEGETPRKIQIWVFAYQMTMAAPDPATEEAKAELVCDESVGVVLAPIGARFVHGLQDSRNESAKRQMANWNTYVQNLGTWLYSTNFHYFMYPYNCFDVIPDDLRFCKSIGTAWMFNQGINTQATNFTAYKEYLIHKLNWDLTRNPRDIRQKFFDTYYGAGAESMSKFYFEMVSQCEWLYDTFEEMTGGIYENLEQAKFWPQQLLERWVKYCDEALDAIAPVAATDPTLYQTLYGNIVCESVFPRYALIRLYESSYSQTEVKAMKASWKADVMQYGFRTHQEHHTIDEIIANW